MNSNYESTDFIVYLTILEKWMEEKINFWSHGNNSSCFWDIRGLFIAHSKLAKLMEASQLTSIIFGDAFLHLIIVATYQFSEYKWSKQCLKFLLGIVNRGNCKKTASFHSEVPFSPCCFSQSTDVLAGKDGCSTTSGELSGSKICSSSCASVINSSVDGIWNWHNNWYNRGKRLGAKSCLSVSARWRVHFLK